MGAVLVGLGVAASLFNAMAPKLKESKVSARYVVNAAGLGSDKIAKMVGDDHFYGNTTMKLTLFKSKSTLVC